MQYFVLLGKEGKIAKSLNNGLSKNSNRVICLNWKFIQKLISNNNNLEKYLLRKFNGKDPDELKIINCLKENTSKNKFQDLHLKLLKIFEGFKIKVRYIFFSTYEANRFPHTKYRKIKNTLENILKEKGVFVIRIGYYLNHSDLNIIRSNKETNIITDINDKNILVPCTTENDLIDLINTNIYSNSKSGLVCCYSRFYALSGGLKYPFIKLYDLKKGVYSRVMLPLEVLSKFFLYISYIFRSFGFSNKISDLLEKPYSLYLFQKIIYKNNN